MNRDLYRVLMNEELIARGMDLQYALLLVKALMNTYYDERVLCITIQREPYSEGNCEMAR